MNYSIFDIEANGFLEKQGDTPAATKIHCMTVYEVIDGKYNEYTFVEEGEMVLYLFDLPQDQVLIGHNIERYDIPMLEKFLGMDLSSIRRIDTLALSWYLYPNEHEHGLEYWGEKLGIAKPKVYDWINDTIETYIVRCQEDVKINTALWNLMIEYLKILYHGITQDIDRIVGYLTFKMNCAREQEEQKWKLDIEKCKSNLAKLEVEREVKVKTLSELMPPNIKYELKERPKVCHKKDGSISVHGLGWYTLLWEHNLPSHHLGSVKVVKTVLVGNPGSHQQMKDWLFSLGWKPDHIKIDKKPNGEVKRIPQIANEEGNDVCDSVKDLYEKVPELEALEGLYVIRHRIGILEGFLRNVDEDGYLKAQIKGLTNTLRFQHTTIVNLPQIPKPYWEEMRGCLIADEGEELCGSDMSGLEDNTKHHYMYFFDPEYVKQMRTPGFDAHIDISVRAKAMSYDEGEFYKWYDNKKDGKVYEYVPTEEFKPMDNAILPQSFTFNELVSLDGEQQAKIIKILKPIRLKMKKGNFASVYGAGVAKLSITLSVPEPQAKKFHTAYWVRNKAVKEVAENCITKTIANQMWLYNPVSRFWYSLREEKDKFSTLNQGTGCYCFDTWVKHIRKQGVKIKGQFHDEKISSIKIGGREPRKQQLLDAIKWTNEEVHLNVPLKVSIDFGDNYAQIH